MSDCVREYFILEYEYRKCAMDNRIGFERNISNGDHNDIDICEKIMRDISVMQNGKQFIFGVALGFLAGYTVTKFGKTMCIVAGSVVIVLQLATLNHYIHFNLVRLLGGQDSATTTRRSNEVQVQSTFWKFWAGLKRFLLGQPNLTSGCIGGLLIGIGFS